MMVELDMTVAREPEPEPAPEPKKNNKALERCAKKAARCRACYWATVHDGVIYCPSVQGTCLRREIIC